MVIKVCDDLSKSISEHTPIRPVLIPGTHTIHAGTLGTMQGGLIGLPYFFEFNKIEEIDGKIQVSHISYTISSNKAKFRTWINELMICLYFLKIRCTSVEVSHTILKRASTGTI